MSDRQDNNPAQRVAEIETPVDLAGVPAVLYQIVEIWTEFAATLEAEIDRDATGMVAAIMAAANGGAAGILKMVTCPTLANLAQAIEHRLMLDAGAEFAAWADGIEAPSDQIVHQAIAATTVPIYHEPMPTDPTAGDPAPFDVVTAAQSAGIERGETFSVEVEW
jgi:hypothetical protein